MLDANGQASADRLRRASAYFFEHWPEALHIGTTRTIMPIRPIIRYPDARLALQAQPVTVFDGALRELARDLLETMHAAPGIGITAP
jgi:polypeptide deformylase